jgi:hypothetical protein
MRDNIGPALIVTVHILKKRGSIPFLAKEFFRAAFHASACAHDCRTDVSYTRYCMQIAASLPCTDMRNIVCDQIFLPHIPSKCHAS